jgi:hypothetical protein
MAAEQVAQTQVGPIAAAYRRLVLTAFANSAQMLADFGVTPPKARTPMTSEQLAARAAKSLATRKARGTTSKKQKLAVKGNVTGVNITPVTASTGTAPAAPVPPVTPASPPAQPVSTATNGTAPQGATVTK